MAANRELLVPKASELMKRGDTKIEHPKARDTDTDTLTTFEKRIPALLQVQNPNTSG